jgi:hypothetical protein
LPLLGEKGRFVVEPSFEDMAPGAFEIVGNHGKISLKFNVRKLPQRSSRLKYDEFVRSRQLDGTVKKLRMQGARSLRNEAYIEVRRNDAR